MEVTEEVLSVGLSDINPRKRKWSVVEETTLIECVVEMEGDLFGDTKGIGLKKKKQQLGGRVGRTYVIT